MVYLAGDNNLSEEMIWALKEMYRVGTNKECNVVVEFDPSATKTGPRLYDVETGSTAKKQDGHRPHLRCNKKTPQLGHIADRF